MSDVRIAWEREDADDGCPMPPFTVFVDGESVGEFGSMSEAARAGYSHMGTCDEPIAEDLGTFTATVGQDRVLDLEWVGGDVRIGIPREKR
jgi:hypothetical protein